MTVLWKNVLVALLIAGALLSLAASVRSAAKVKLSETPKYTGPWGIPGQLSDLLGLWNETLGYAIFGLALLGGAWLVSRTYWGLEVVWSGGAWTPVAAAVETAAEFEVLEPGESWKANLFWGCVMGLPFGLSALFADGKWSAARGFGAALAFGFLLWMVQSAVENYSRTVRLSGAGLEERSVFGRRRIPWEEIGGLEFQDVREQIQRLQDWRTRRSSTLPRIDIWAVKDRGGREVFRLPAGMQPDDAFRKMRERIEKRTSAR